jgi:hypothetical protein
LIKSDDYFSSEMAQTSSHFQKWTMIREKLFEQLCEWKRQRQIVHDNDLKEAALLLAEQHDLLNFKIRWHLPIHTANVFRQVTVGFGALKRNIKSKNKRICIVQRPGRR